MLMRVLLPSKPFTILRAQFLPAAPYVFLFPFCPPFFLPSGLTYEKSIISFVCIDRYESAQVPFHRNNLPAPALVFTVLLTSDPRLKRIHGYHQATGLLMSANNLMIHMSAIEADISKDITLTSALQEKLTSCVREKDTLGITFWSDRLAEKRKNIEDLQAEMGACRREYDAVSHELEDDAASLGARGLTMRRYAENEEKEEFARRRDTLNELAAWRAGNNLDGESTPFPPLESVLNPSPTHLFGQFRPDHRRHYGRFGHFAGHKPPVLPVQSGTWEERRRPTHNREVAKTFIDRVSDVVQQRSPATSLVPTQEIKSLLDTFLMNLSNQLGTTFDDAPVAVSSEINTTGSAENEPAIPGAFIIPQPSVDVTDHVQTERSEGEKGKPVKPVTKLGKGGFKHKHISCDGCLNGIRGMRYKCEVSKPWISYSLS